MKHDRRTFLRTIGATGIGAVAAGTAGTAGAQDSEGEIVVEGGGADIWNDADEFHYYFTDVGENFDAAVRVDSVEDTNEFAKAGLMLRESLDADAKNVMTRTTPDHTTLQWRPSAGGESTSLTSDVGESESEIDGGTIDANWQRLVRTGETIRAYASEDGANWTLMAEITLSFGESAFLGLAVTSHNTGTLCEARFSNLGGVAPVQSQDIGDVDVAGSASGSSSGDTGPLVVTGSATDVTSSAATLSSTVYSLGGASSADVAIEYREAGGSWTSSATETVTEPGAVDVDLTGLSPETDYEYRALVETNDGQSDSGTTVSFATSEVDTDPSVTTGTAVDTAASSATLSGTLEDVGGQAETALVSFDYRESAAGDWESSGSRTLSEPGEFETTIYGLSPETDYEFRAVVEADDGDTDAGSTSTFSTTEGTGGDGGSHFGLEDGFADVDWFDDSVEVIKIEEAALEPIQEAFTTEGPRLIVFEESGVIDLEGADLSITYGDCWVAGQTAPSPGITFINGMVQAEQDNTVIEHIRVLRGDRSGGEGTDPMNSRDGANNIIFNHCSVFWGRDENMSVGYDSNKTTIANCMIAEGLEDPEENSNGTLVGDGADNVAILGSIYAKNNDRNPRLKSDTRTVVANNLNYYHDKAIWIDGGAEASVVGNAYIHRFSFRDPLVFGDGSVHMEDNYVADPPLDGRPFSDVGTELDSPPLWPSGLEALPAGNVESHNKTFAGARPADRIYQEQKVVDQITDRWGTLDVDPNEDNAGFSDIPDSAAEAGGYPDHGGTTHTLDVPDVGLREWLDYWSQQVVAGDGDGGPPENTDPVVTTDDATEVDVESATLEGSLDDLGEASSVTVSFEYRESDADAWSATGTQTLTSTGEFSETVDGLSSSTAYEFRAVVEYDGETDTGFTATFTTAFDGGGEGGSRFDYADGFASPSWIDTEDVDVYRIQEATREAVEEAFHASGPRVVVFETSGTIDISGETLRITEDKCWVAGQTAPSPGITFIGGMLQVDANDCVVQHIRTRIGPGDGSIQSNDAINTQDDTQNNVFDHVTASWGVDECLSVGYDTQDTTVTNCLIYEGLHDPYGDGADHNYGTLIGDGASNVTLAGNVWAKARGRIPRLKNDTETVVVNNFTYFFDESANADGSAVTSFVGNVYTGLTDTGDAVLEGSPTAYHRDNVTADPPLDGQSFAEVDSESSPPLWPSALDDFSPDEVESHNLQYAGARPADRTENDQRIVGEIADRAGNDRLDSPYDYWLAHPDDVGGYPDLPVNTHSIEVPDSGLRAWLEEWALAVEESDAEPPGEGDGEDDVIEVNGYEAQDTTGDGRYNDINGDGDTSHEDVTAFFEHLESDGVQENSDAFDFADDGDAGFTDVIALFEEM